MLRSTSTFLAMAVLCMQVALARIETGLYEIRDMRGYTLGISEHPPIFPPPDVPVRLLPGGVRPQRWFVEEKEGGLTISTRKDDPFAYKIIAHDDVVYVSAQKAPETWAVTSVGHDMVEIKSPFEDRVFTAEHDREESVQLRGQDGSPNQMWTFVRID
ncbi:hypothetical protein BGZ93_002974, partial [Podila epicladia]